MIQSMWSAVAGLRTHQVKMDVIGNDVANVNTTAYKSNDVTFRDQLYETLKSAGVGSAGQQIGMGVQVGQIARNFTDGVLIETGQSTNIAISGSGFFPMGDSATATTATTYTRAGDFQFTLNTAGDTLYLMSPDGRYLLGSTSETGTPSTPLSIPATALEIRISSAGAVSYVPADGTAPVVAGYVKLAMFPNKSGLKAIGNNQFQATDGSGTATYQTTAGNQATIYQGYLENSNVDLAKEFTDMIITQRGFQANSKAITTSDEMLQEILSLKR